jgi:hypothetical protein
LIKNNQRDGFLALGFRVSFSCRICNKRHK